MKEAPYHSGRGRALRVVCIGAGAAGIYLGIKLPRSFREGAVDLQASRLLWMISGCRAVLLCGLIEISSARIADAVPASRFTRRTQNLGDVGTRIDILV